MLDGHQDQETQMMLSAEDNTCFDSTTRRMKWQKMSMFLNLVHDHPFSTLLRLVTLRQYMLAVYTAKISMIVCILLV